MSEYKLVVREMVEKFRPIVYLHPKDENMPCHIEKYLQNSSLWLSDKKLLDTVTTVTIPTGPETQSMNLKVSDEFKKGEGVDVPYYVHVKELDDGNVEIQYIFIYAYNGGYKVCGMPCLMVGQHEADIEHIAVIVDPVSEKAVKYYYAAHGRKDGKWLTPDKIEYENGRPVVYSAKGSHGSYWKGKTYGRCVWAVSDKTAKGRRWDGEVEYINDETRWNLYQGYLGSPDHVRVPKGQSWWTEESKISTNCFCRLFCICR